MDERTTVDRRQFLRSLLAGPLLVTPGMAPHLTWARDRGYVRTFRWGEQVGVSLLPPGRSHVQGEPTCCLCGGSGTIQVRGRPDFCSACDGSGQRSDAAAKLQEAGG